MYSLHLPVIIKVLFYLLLCEHYVVCVIVFYRFLSVLIVFAAFVGDDCSFILFYLHRCKSQIALFRQASNVSA